MKGVVDFFLGFAVLLVGVVLLFLAFLNVRDQQSSLPEVIRQNRVTASRASTQDSGNTSLAQCGRSADQQGVAEALYNTFSQIWGPEGLLVVLGRGAVQNSESWTVYCGSESAECGENSDPIELQVAGCLSLFGEINNESSWYFMRGDAFGNVCGIIDNNNRLIGEEGDDPPQDSGCNHHGDCELTQYCYAGSCLDCPEGYKRRGVAFSQGMFWFLRNFRLATFLKLLFSPLQANPNSQGAEDPGNQGGNQNTEGNENQHSYDHPFCEPCSDEEMQQCTSLVGNPY